MRNLLNAANRLPIAPICLTFLGACLWPEMELLVPSLPGMKAFFSVTDGEIQQLLSTNFIGFLCGVLLAGPLADAFGRKKIILFGMVIFLIASFIAAMSTNFTFLLVMRFVQGISVTAPIIGGSAMLFELTTGHRQIFWMSISSASITLCMAGAPLIGASINNHFGFQGNLWAIFIAGLVGFMPVLFFVKETLPREHRTAFGLRGIATSYFSLLKNCRFIALMLVITSLPAAYWVYTGVSSLYLVDYLALDPELFGIYQGPIVGTFALLSIFMPHIHRRFSLKTCLVTGFIFMLIGAFSLLLLSLLNLETALSTTLFMMLFVGGMVPVNTLLFPCAVNLLPNELKGSGQSMIQASRLLLASLGTIALGFVYTGPFLPVAIILGLMFVLSWVLLFRFRSSLSTSPSQQFIASH